MRRFTILPAFLLICAASASSPAFAQGTGAPAPSSQVTGTQAPGNSGGALRDFSLRNQSHQAVVEATAETSAGHLKILGEGGQIAPSQARTFQLGAGQCVQSLRVKLQDGRVLRAAGLKDCHDPELLVRDGGIAPVTQAVPGTTPKPGE